MKETKERLSLLAEIICLREEKRHLKDENTVLKLVVRGVNNENTKNNQ